MDEAMKYGDGIENEDGRERGRKRMLTSIPHHER